MRAGRIDRPFPHGAAVRQHGVEEMDFAVTGRQPAPAVEQQTGVVKLRAGFFHQAAGQNPGPPAARQLRRPGAQGARDDFRGGAIIRRRAAPRETFRQQQQIGGRGGGGQIAQAPQIRRQIAAGGVLNHAHPQGAARQWQLARHGGWTQTVSEKKGRPRFRGRP